MQIDKDLVAASATPLVLGVLARGDSYGYALLSEVRRLSDGRMEWTDGMLYPLLHRLERTGMVESYWETPSTGRRRKHYALTGVGREALAERRQQWAVVSSALDRAWEGLGPATDAGYA
ncbi:PadR family transcriptional regulator [Tsukamurella sp. 8F]|uniref:PadR family transcriptional regulator n=1 Tax=unclassified Tsukamurella TaxID=2633480 RepID=UPI0023B95D35|nr:MULTISPECIES: PadR family transcriptional regulator [unclassified Tsukamurella]MDF0530149.1 PadR family transcriptional regulator [Tsukamurella sp. 8J]MDF0586467.1 PadR family transcriptional regulator [Tsukamurella sp. 8F]